MIDVLLIVHLLLALAMIGAVLLQRSEGGALGIGGSGGGGMSGFLTGRGTANLLTRTTAILAACFIATSLLLTILTTGGGKAPTSILDQIPAASEEAPVEPSGPTVPVQ